MDPISQGVLGTIASQNTSQFQRPHKSQFVILSILGFLSGLAPDLDVLIRSETDPLLFLTYHRQFTHSLIFIPIGGFICAVVFYFLFSRKWEMTFKHTAIYCTAGYATHALLDSCTTYGTQLFWPFSDVRIAWNTISIIDPLFTLPLLVLIIIAAIKRNALYSKIALVWILCYTGFGILQRERAEKVGWELAHSREHTPIRLEAKPGFANLLVWKVIYETEGQFHVDGVRLGLTPTIYPGASIEALDVDRDFPWLDSGSQQAEDIRRFKWFSNNYVAMHPTKSNTVMDIRYSMLPNEIEALWMIELNAEAPPNQHVSYAHQHARNDEAFKTLWAMIRNQFDPNQ